MLRKRTNPNVIIISRGSYHGLNQLTNDGLAASLSELRAESLSERDGLNGTPSVYSFTPSVYSAIEKVFFVTLSIRSKGSTKPGSINCPGRTVTYPGSVRTGLIKPGSGGFELPGSRFAFPPDPGSEGDAFLSLIKWLFYRLLRIWVDNAWSRASEDSKARPHAFGYEIAGPTPEGVQAEQGSISS